MKFTILITASLGLLVSTTKALPVTSNGSTSRADDIKIGVKVPGSTGSCNHDSLHQNVARSEDTKDAEDMQVFGTILNPPHYHHHYPPKDKAARSEDTKDMQIFGSIMN
jgi:hypothetical protein